MKSNITVFEPYRFAEKVCGMKAARPSCFILLIILCTCFSSLKAEPGSFILSHQKPGDPAKVASEDSSKNRVKAQPSKLAFFERRAEGWHWYEDREGGMMKKNLSNKRGLMLPTLKPQRRKLRLNERNSRQNCTRLFSSLLVRIS
jgi:hypothetical protein